MTQSTHYSLNLAEGTDLVNPLTIDVPNYQAIDSAMFANEQAGVGTATELKSGTIHALTRANQNQSTFKFRATSNFVTGDTFTVDGSVVTALNVNGSALTTGCFIIGSEVLCTLVNTQLTVIGVYIPIASDVPFDDTNVSFTASNVQSAIESTSQSIDSLNNNQDSGFIPVTGRTEILEGGYYIRGNMVFVNVKIKGLTTLTNIPAVLLVNSAHKPSHESALSAIDITAGIDSLSESIPCGIATTGYIYVTKITTDRIYQISGWYLK